MLGCLARRHRELLYQIYFAVLVEFYAQILELTHLEFERLVFEALVWLILRRLLFIAEFSLLLNTVIKLVEMVF